jgi:hypothetical protein
MAWYQPVVRLRIPPGFWAILQQGVRETAPPSPLALAYRCLDAALARGRPTRDQDVYLPLDAAAATHLAAILHAWLEKPDSVIGRVGPYRRTAYRLLRQLESAQQRADPTACCPRRTVR